MRVAFWAFAGLLFIGTHWPNLRIEGPVQRTDLWVHLSVFGTWMLLACLCRFFGPTAAWGNVWRTWLAAITYAAFDEGLQLIPALHRTAAWDDYAANVTGITLAGALVLILGRAAGPRSTSGETSTLPADARR